jgi:hypothetical protein
MFYIVNNDILDSVVITDGRFDLQIGVMADVPLEAL